MFHKGQRALQDKYGGRKVADKIAEIRRHDEFNEEDRDIIETAPVFFLATSFENSVDCSMKGGEPGFIRVIGPSTLAFPDYDGNRMYRSLGNILNNPNVGLLFVRFDGVSTRLRVNGVAEVDDRPKAISGLPGAKRLIRVTARDIFPNCPRYVPEMEGAQPSIYAPRAGYTPPEPEWKSRDYIKNLIEEN